MYIYHTPCKHTYTPYTLSIYIYIYTTTLSTPSHAHISGRFISWRKSILQAPFRRSLLLQRHLLHMYIRVQPARRGLLHPIGQGCGGSKGQNYDRGICVYK